MNRRIQVAQHAKSGLVEFREDVRGGGLTQLPCSGTIVVRDARTAAQVVRCRIPLLPAGK